MQPDLYHQIAEDIGILEKARRVLGGELIATSTGVILRIGYTGYTGTCYQHLDAASAAKKAGT